MQSRRVSSGVILLAIAPGGSSTLFGQAGAPAQGYYESGHMVYIDQPSATKYHADLTKLVHDSLPN